MHLKGLYETIAACRHFFASKGFLETPTPPIVENPGMEAHLHPFQVKSLHQNKDLNLYLHTSPEFFMKKLLSEGFEKIYHLGWCFRDEPKSHTHRPQFLMLEWYRAGVYYTDIQKDTLELINFVHEWLKDKKIITGPTPKKTYKTVDQLFQEILDFSILDFLSKENLRDKIINDMPELLPNKSIEMPWEDYFYLIFLNKIEPEFEKYELLVVDKFPAPLAALSTISPDDPRVCERFEIYLKGIELCNCFNELTDLDEQKKRMREEKNKKKALYDYELNEPQVLYQALEKGLPPAAGNALGVERLFLGLCGNKEDFNPFATSPE